jgi:epsilon-lactone hydrolase
VVKTRVAADKSSYLYVAMALFAGLLWTSGGTAALGQLSPTATIDPDGTVHLGPHTVPLPPWLSPQARKKYIEVYQYSLKNPPIKSPQAAVAHSRQTMEAFGQEYMEETRTVYPVKTVSQKIAGVPSIVVTPRDGVSIKNRDRVLINIHGGGFVAGSEVLVDSIPPASLGKIRVIFVDYRLAPEHPFPAGLDDLLAVYKELIKTYKPENIGIYGTSAGANLTASIALYIRQNRLPLPGGLGIISMGGPGDTLVTNNGLDAFLSTFGMPPVNASHLYIGSHNPNDPLIAPLNGDFTKGYPPAILIAGTRDMLLSSTVRLHRKLREAGIDAELNVFEGQGHAFNDLYMPEADEAWREVVAFFDTHLGIKVK